jgi:nicotinate phosphoribosyltransferase
MAHDSEAQAFERYVATFPDNALLLVDTYDTIEGTRRAIKAAGSKLRGVRLDSGDLLTLSRAVRGMLDEAGLKQAQVVATGDLNEYKIRDLIKAGAPIDVWGVGTDLVRSRDVPALGGVYKMVYDHTRERPVAKFSDAKSSLPGLHQVFRRVRNGKAERDIIGTLPEFHVDTVPLLVPWMREGKLVREPPTLAKLRSIARAQLQVLPDALHAFEPVDDEDRYPVEVSDVLSTLSSEVRVRLLGGEA